MRRFSRGLVGLAVFIVGFMLGGTILVGQGQSQSDCQLTTGPLSEQYDVFFVERQIEVCGNNLDALLAQVDEELAAATDREAEARLRTYRALILEGQGEHFEASVTHGRVLSLYRELGDARLEAWTLYYLGRTNFNNRQFDASITFYNQAVQVARRNDISFVLGRALVAQGLYEWENGNTNSTIVILEDSLESLLIHIEDTVPEQRIALRTLASAYTNVGQDIKSRIYRDMASSAGTESLLKTTRIEGAGFGDCQLTDITTEPDILTVERSIGQCITQLPLLREQVETAFPDAGQEDQARLHVFLGLIYEAEGDSFEAQRAFERGLLAYREAGNPRLEAWALYYMGRVLFDRNQPVLARSYMDQAIDISSRQNDLFNMGRVDLERGLDLVAQGSLGEAGMVLETAYTNLSASVDVTPEIIAVLTSLNEVYGQLNDPQKAGRYGELLETARGDTRSASNQMAVAGCPEELALETNVIRVERNLSLCNLGELALSARWLLADTDNARDRGRAQMYFALVFYERRDFLNAHIELDKAVAHFRQVNDQQLLGLNYYYLSLSYFNNNNEDAALAFLSQARRASEAARDSFNLGRVQYVEAAYAWDRRDTFRAADLLDASLANLQASPIPSREEQRQTLNLLITLYSHLEGIRNDQKLEEYRELRASLDSTNDGELVQAPTADVSRQAASTPESAETDVATASGAVSCDVERLATETDINAFAVYLDDFCTGDLSAVLLRVQSGRQAATDTLDIARLQNYLGIVYYYLGDYQNAFAEHDRALARYRQAGDRANEAITLFYGGRAAAARENTSIANSYLGTAQRLLTTEEDFYNLGQLALYRGETAYINRDLERALESYVTARENFISADAPRFILESTLLLADLYTEMSQFENAPVFYDEALQLAEAQADTESLVMAQIGAARYHKYFGRYEIALEFVDQAIALADTPVLTALAMSEKADIAREIGEYAITRDMLSNIPLNTLDCVTGDQVRLYNGWYLISIGRASDASAVFRQIIETLCDGRSSLTTAHAYAGLAEAQLLRRQADQNTLDSINDALREYDATNYPRGYQFARIQLARFEQYRRDWSEAERWLATATRNAEDFNDIRGLVDVTMARVEISFDRGRYGDALNLLGEASGYYDSIDHTIGLRSTLETRLRIYLDQARYEEAINLIDFARQEYRNASLSFDSRIAYYQGQLYEQQGQNELALVFYNQALDGFTESEEILNVLEVTLRIANVFQRRGQFDDAGELIAASLELATSLEDNFYLAQAQMLAGDNALLAWSSEPQRDINDPAIRTAEESYTLALEGYELVGNIAGEAATYNRLGELQLLRLEAGAEGSRDARGNAGNFNSALERYRTIGNSIGEATALANLGRFNGLLRSYDTAHSFFFQALIVLGDADPFLRADILTNQGLVYEYQHTASYSPGTISRELLAARDAYEEATQLLEFAYTEIDDNSVQRAFGTQDRTLVSYERLLRIYSLNVFTNREDDAALALDIAERGRARSYLTQLQGEELNYFGTDNPALAEWQALRSELVNLNRVLNDVKARSGDAAETDEIQTQIDEKIVQIQALEAEVDVDAVSQFVGINVVDAAELQAAIPEDSAMLIYYVVRERNTPEGFEASRVAIFVVKRDSITLTSSRVDNWVEDVANQIDIYHRVQGTQQAESLYLNLVHPVAEEIDPVRNLIIVPHSILNYVPFDALMDVNGEPVLTNHNVSYVPSATVYTLLRDTVRPATSGGQTLAIGYPGDTHGLTPLFYYRDELVLIEEALIDVESYVEDQATESRLIERMNEAEVIHIAAHGVFMPDDPLSSFIALAPDTEHNGLLEVREIYELSLQDTNPLVTLSACQLAVSQINPGDELEGMIRAFLLTGARGVIASLWYVDDFVTAELMVAFYEYRAQGMTNAEALAEAKREIQALYGDPYLWAGFVLVGLEN
ncbi:MAG: CHAT domain-containing protein [Chloroflexota bacterium]